MYWCTTEFKYKQCAKSKVQTATATLHVILEQMLLKHTHTDAHYFSTYSLPLLMHFSQQETSASKPLAKKSVSCVWSKLIATITPDLLSGVTPFARPRKTEVRRCQVWTVWWVLAHFPSPPLRPVFGHPSCVGHYTVMDTNTKAELSWPLSSNSFSVCPQCCSNELHSLSHPL